MSPARALIDSTIDFLVEHPPFQRMARELLERLAQTLKLGYFPRGTTLLKPDGTPASGLFIVQRGEVHGDLPTANGTESATASRYGVGEMFPIGALAAAQPITSEYKAVEDTFAYEAPAAAFRELSEQSAEFRAFCTQYVATLLMDLRRSLQDEFVRAVGEQQSLSSSLATLLRREPISAHADASVGEVLTRMHKFKIGSMVIVDERARPVGIFTERDVISRVALGGVDLGAPIADVMTRSPATLPVESTAFEAAMLMGQKNIRHVPVVREGRLVGLVSERDLFALQRVNVRQLAKQIDLAEDDESLGSAAQGIRQLANNMLAQGVAAEQLTQCVSALNDRLTAQIINLARARHPVSDATFCWMALGSEGRIEQTIATDQDNAIVFRASAGESPQALRERLLPFAKEVNETLDTCGFPLCKGEVMAMNPRWCLSFEEWQVAFRDWMRNTDPEAVMNAGIFFDFRALVGEEALVQQLKEWLLAEAKARPAFFRAMAQSALTVRPPLGPLGGIVAHASKDEPGTLDLKQYGARPFVDAARVLAYAHGVAATNTAQRIRGSWERLGQDKAEADALVDSFHFVQLLRLRNQQRLIRDGKPPHNRVKPDELNDLDRRILKEAFKQARTLQARVALDYQL